jgi:hypothetical protein
MRPVYACFCMFAGLVSPALAGEMDVAPFHPVIPDVTVILDIKGQLPPGAMRQMQRETSQIIGPSGIRLEWRSLSEGSAGTFKDLVVLTFNGSCSLDSTPPIQNGPGAYAFTRTADGAVQPFGEVDCDRVVNSVKTASAAEDRGQADLLMGRALGRVVAHELVHMLTHSGEHGSEGVEKSALSGRQLISASLPLSGPDMERLKQRVSGPVNRGIDTQAESEIR